jgi:phage-related holin
MFNKNEILKEWGFSCWSDLAQSTLHVKNYKPMLSVSLTLSGISTLTNSFLGLEPMVYLSFILLILLEFITGISASVKEGKKIESKRLGRFVVKITVYTLMIAIANILKTNYANDIVGKVYNFIYWIILHFITIQLIVSVFENMSRLGFQESSRIFKKINQFMSKWFDVKK